MLDYHELSQLFFRVAVILGIQDDFSFIHCSLGNGFFAWIPNPSHFQSALNAFHFSPNTWEFVISFIGESLKDSLRSCYLCSFSNYITLRVNKRQDCHSWNVLWKLLPDDHFEYLQVDDCRQNHTARKGIPESWRPAVEGVSLRSNVGLWGEDTLWRSV